MPEQVRHHGASRHPGLVPGSTGRIGATAPTQGTANAF